MVEIFSRHRSFDCKLIGETHSVTKSRDEEVPAKYFHASHHVSHGLSLLCKRNFGDSDRILPGIQIDCAALFGASLAYADRAHSASL